MCSVKYVVHQWPPPHTSYSMAKLVLALTTLGAPEALMPLMYVYADIVSQASLCTLFARTQNDPSQSQVKR